MSPLGDLYFHNDELVLYTNEEYTLEMGEAIECRLRVPAVDAKYNLKQGITFKSVIVDGADDEVEWSLTDNTKTQQFLPPKSNQEVPQLISKIPTSSNGYPSICR
eukprot:UN04007